MVPFQCVFGIGNRYTGAVDEGRRKYNKCTTYSEQGNLRRKFHLRTFGLLSFRKRHLETKQAV